MRMRMPVFTSNFKKKFIFPFLFVLKKKIRIIKLVFFFEKLE